MNRATPATGWVRNPVMKSPDLDPVQASSYDYGWTWNPITGCLNHVNGLCRGGNFPCYAYGLAKGRCQQRYLGHGELYMKGLVDLDPFYPRFWPKKLAEILPPLAKDEYRHFNKYRKPKGIFACDMGDLFGIGVPETWTKQVLDAIRKNGQDRFYLLTKQPQNLVKFPPPDNCWVGVTACNQTMLQKALSSEGLASAKAGAKFISFEPLLQRMDGLADYLYCVDWVIIGAQTKPVVYPKVEWVEEIVEACDKVGVAVFLKDNLESLIVQVRDGQKYAPGWANGGYGTLRQEMPVKK